MTTKIYAYKNCDSCKKALKFLHSIGIQAQEISIVDQPPTVEELKKMAGYLAGEGATFVKLFNTSGQVYRELNISEKIRAGMTEAEALHLLAKNGKLIKRPFLLTKNGGKVGFDPKAWSELLT